MTLRALCITAVVVLAASSADAATCTVSATSVGFGAYNVFDSAPSDSTATILLRCNGNARNIAVGISDGEEPLFDWRRLGKGKERLLYNLYRDAGRFAIWGDGSGGTQMHVQSEVPNNTEVPLTVYGRIPAGQDVSAGAYSDSVVVTINY